MFNKVLVANRGAVAARVLRALQEMGIASVAVYSEADQNAPYLELASETLLLGPAPVRDSYLNQERLLELIEKSGADGVHPGYGFLSENAAFAQKVIDQGVGFIGPSPRWIDAMGHKTRARALAVEHGMPMAKGSSVLGVDLLPEQLQAIAHDIGFPVLVKPAGGGGGIGMLPALEAGELMGAIERSRSLASRGFGSQEVYLEKLFVRPRHVEFQLLGDQHGHLRHLYERDCSIQRRNQKVIEEACAPGLERGSVNALAEKIATIMRGLGYDNIGTVEMLMDEQGAFHFLEMNTRLQVEHGVTEAITGVDLVQAQIRCAAGLRLTDILPQTIDIQGHAIQARVYAEDPKNFYPSPGTLTAFQIPVGTGIRVETGYRQGQVVTPYYDPMMAKVIVKAANRPAAIQGLIEALERFDIQGLKHNIPALLTILRSEAFQSGRVHTGLMSELFTKKK